MQNEQVSNQLATGENTNSLMTVNPNAIEPKEPDKTTVVEARALKKGEILALSVLLSWKYSFCRLAINRVINPNVVKKKKASIKAAKGVISPSLIVSAKDCLDAGLEVIDWEGNKITYETPNLESYIVIVDGQHRHDAIIKLNEKLKDGEKYENYYYLPLIEEGNVIDMLRESNVATQPWRGSDYLTALIVAKKDVDIPMLLFVKERQQDSSDTAAWLWATLDENRIYKKAKINRAIRHEQTFKDISKDDDFENGKALYEAMSHTFNETFVGLKPCPLWTIGKFRKLRKVKGDEYAVQKLKDFFSKVSRTEAETIEKLKGQDGESKDDRITKALDKLYDEKMTD